MLSNDNIRNINRQIENELRDVNSIRLSDEEKSAALDRIIKLKSLLTTQPSREEILAELADALAEAQRNPPPTFADNLMTDIVGLLRNKR